MSNKKVFLIVLVQNHLQWLESAILQQFIEKTDPNDPTIYKCITPQYNSTYAALYGAHFDNNFFIDPKTKKSILLEKDKTKNIAYCDIAYTAINIYNMCSCDVVLSEGNDVVISPDTVALQSIALTLGIPTCLWRNDARLLWASTQSPITLTTVQPAFTAHAQLSNFGIESLRNGKVQNNIRLLLNQTLSPDSFGSKLSLPTDKNNKIRILHHLGNLLLNTYGLNKIINGRLTPDQAIQQFMAIKNCFENNQSIFNKIDQQFMSTFSWQTFKPQHGGNPANS